MASKHSNMTNVRWIASRSYSVKRGGDKQAQTVLVALTAPRKLRKSEYPIRTELSLYGCVVQTGAVHTRRIVPGRDSAESLSHSLLAIDRFLTTISKSNEIRSLDGKPFDPKVDGLFVGPIGREYKKK